MDGWPKLTRAEQAAVDAMTGLAERRVTDRSDRSELEAIAAVLQTVPVRRRSLILAVCLQRYLDGHGDEWSALPFLVMCDDRTEQLAHRLYEARTQALDLAALADTG